MGRYAALVSIYIIQCICDVLLCYHHTMCVCDVHAIITIESDCMRCYDATAGNGGLRAHSMLT